MYSIDVLSQRIVQFNSENQKAQIQFFSKLYWKGPKLEPQGVF